MVPDISTRKRRSGEAKVLEESESNSGCWELCEAVLCKDLSNLTLLLCGKTDELGNVSSEGKYQLKISSAEAPQCGMRSTCDLET